MTITETHAASTTDTQVPDLSSYRAIHQAMRNSNARLADGIASARLGDEHRFAALLKWFGGYNDELHVHHRLEDDLFFPALAARVPGFAELDARLAADHERLDDLLQELTATLTDLTINPFRAHARDRALHVAIELRDMMNEHLDVEDRDVLSLFERHFAADEYAVLDQQAVKSITIRQAMFTAPWYMSAAEPAAAAKTLADAPLPLKIVLLLTKRGFARLEQAAFGQHA